MDLIRMGETRITSRQAPGKIIATELGLTVELAE